MEVKKRFCFVLISILVFFLAERQCILGNEIQENLPPSLLEERNPSIIIPKRTNFRVSRGRAHRNLMYKPGYYYSCGHNVWHCFPGKESECFEKRNCTYLVKWHLIPKTQYVEFQVVTKFLTEKTNEGQLCDKTPNSGKTPYLAIGFSSKSSGTNIAVVECTIKLTGSKEKNVAFASSSKFEYERYNSYKCDETTDIGKLRHCQVDLDQTTNSMMCHFQIKRRVVFKHEIFNFEDSQYFMHLVSGCDISDIKTSIKQGGKYQESDQIKQFHINDDDEVASFRSHYAIWHGCLMTVAFWILVPNGIFISRYFKESLVDVSIFKYRVWFAGHSIVMIMAFLITLGAMGSILQEKAEVEFAWPTKKSVLLHFNLGATASLLLILQISIGWIRCHGKKIRRSFAAIHLFSGCTCYIVAMVCIGFSFNVGMPCNVMYYTAFSGSWALICHVAMTIHFHLVDKQLGLFISRALYPFPIPPVTYDELPGTKIRIGIFFIHLIGSILLSITTIIDYLTGVKCEG